MLDQATKLLEDTMRYAEERDYAGYSKFDGLESPLAKALTLGLPIGRLIIQQAVKLSTPFDIRPFLLIRKERNPKGVALFANAAMRSGDHQRGKELLDWLIANNSQAWRGRNFAGPCWGYNFHWQSPGFEAPRFMPNIIVTSFVAEAMWQGYLATGEERFKDATLGAIRFITEELPLLVNEPDCLCVGYVPTEKPFVVVNVNAVSAGLMIKVWKETGEQSLLDRARKQLNFVERARTKYDAWFYTHPAGDSPIRHDNYHTGGILDGILDYIDVLEGAEQSAGEWRGVYERGLAFYKEALFEQDGAPRWMNDAKFPHDVHGAAQGVITFSRAGDREMAEKILGWAVANLLRKDGAWSYQIGANALTTKRYTLMRWCNAWMAYALAHYRQAFAE